MVRTHLYFHVFIFQCVIDNVPDRSQGEGKQRLSFTADLVRSDLDIGPSPYLDFENLIFRTLYLYLLEFFI